MSWERHDKLLVHQSSTVPIKITTELSHQDIKDIRFTRSEGAPRILTARCPMSSRSGKDSHSGESAAALGTGPYVAHSFSEAQRMLPPSAPTPAQCHRSLHNTSAFLRASLSVGRVRTEGRVDATRATVGLDLFGLAVHSDALSSISPVGEGTTTSESTYNASLRYLSCYFGSDCCGYIASANRAGGSIPEVWGGGTRPWGPSRKRVPKCLKGPKTIYTTIAIAEKQSKRSKKAHFVIYWVPPSPTQELELTGPGGEDPSRSPWFLQPCPLTA